MGDFCIFVIVKKLLIHWLIGNSFKMENKLKGQGLSMEALMGQLGDSAEFNDLKQKVSKIEKSKVIIVIYQN